MAKPINLFWRSVIYAARYETDGFLPDASLKVFGRDLDNKHRACGNLVRVGLWTEVDGGWLIHDFLDYHPSHAQQEDRRAADAERKRRARKGFSTPERVMSASDNGRTSESVRDARPDPSPLRSRLLEEARTRARENDDEPAPVGDYEKNRAGQCIRCNGTGFMPPQGVQKVGDFGQRVVPLRCTACQAVHDVVDVQPGTPPTVRPTDWSRT